MFSNRLWQDRVRDILDALAEIRMFTAQLTFRQFQTDLKTIRAVEMSSSGASFTSSKRRS